MKIKKGDTVKILVGKDADREGRVLAVLPDRNKIVVEGINIYKKHLKGDGKQKKSAIIEVAKPIQISNVMVICPACGKPSRVTVKVEGKKRVRVCKKCKADLEDAPVEEEEKTSKKKSKAASTKKTTKKKTDSKKTKTKTKTKKSTTKK